MSKKKEGRILTINYSPQRTLRAQGIKYVYSVQHEKKGLPFKVISDHFEIKGFKGRAGWSSSLPVPASGLIVLI
jgi:hypothetical protein